jgi:hypothetical protein
VKTIGIVAEAMQTDASTRPWRAVSARPVASADTAGGTAAETVGETVCETVGGACGATAGEAACGTKVAVGREDEAEAGWEVVELMAPIRSSQSRD